ncbi:MAG: hypothetical protein KGJ23_14705 [Euryarchaeota archaeon]|nr:hypothetical protein [Euryarchaeota archaeon]MDE2046290.1 hypothetical protein [Thermoplasmata archaeon]
MPHSPGGSSFLRRLFTTAGWSVEEVPGGWSAHARSESTTVLAYLEGGLPAGFQRYFPSEAQRILVLFGHVPEPHDRDRVELTGAHVVLPDDVPGTVLALLHLRPESSPRPGSGGPPGGPSPEPSLTTRAEEPPTSATPRPGGGSAPPAPPPLPPPPSLRSSRRTASLRSEVSSSSLPSEPPSPFPPVLFETDRIVRPRLQAEDIHQMATQRWRGGVPRMVLVPFHLFAYSIPEDEGATSSPPRLVAAPLVGGLPQFWPTGEREIVSALHVTHRRASPRLSPEAARRSAEEAVRERHARTEERAEKVRGYLLIEHIQRPLEGREVHLGPPALVWVPHWVVEAWNGREVIDAVSGLAVELPLDPGEVGE